MEKEIVFKVCRGHNGKYSVDVTVENDEEFLGVLGVIAISFGEIFYNISMDRNTAISCLNIIREKTMDNYDRKMELGE